MNSNIFRRAVRRNEHDQNERASCLGHRKAETAALAGARLSNVWSAASDPAISIITRVIPSSGEAHPVMGLGTWQTFDIEPESAERRPLEAVLEVFADLGGRLVDTSPMYGRSEEVLGEIATTRNLRNTLFFATKVWTSGRLAGIRQMEESFRRLRANRIDLMQVHNLVDAATQLETLREWKREGRVRYIGVTHYAAAGHDAVARIVPHSSSILFRSTIRLANARRKAIFCRWPWPRCRGNRQPAICGRRPLSSAAKQAAA